MTNLQNRKTLFQIFRDIAFFCDKGKGKDAIITFIAHEYSTTLEVADCLYSIYEESS